jgi:hypothetical protein
VPPALDDGGWNMTPRSRARWARAAALIALAGAALVVPSAPAAGAPAPISILSVSAENVKPGDKVRVRFRVTNNGGGAETAVVVVGGGLRCTAGCRAEPNLAAGKSRDFEATVVAPDTGPGETTGLNISVAVRLGGQNSYDFRMVYVHGAGAPGAGTPSAGADQVGAVSGRVRDSGGKAAVTVRDSAGHEYRATTDRSGRFSVRSTAGKPIAGGRITVAAAKEGYRTARTTVKGPAGETVSVRMTLATASASASPSDDVAASPLAEKDETPRAEPSLAAAADPNFRAVNDEGSGSPMFIALGGLLVAAGLGALVLMVVRRRRSPGEPAPSAAGLDEPPTAVLPAPGFPGRYGTPPPAGRR